jgi:hypothetical protein
LTLECDIDDIDDDDDRMAMDVNRYSVKDMVDNMLAAAVVVAVAHDVCSEDGDEEEVDVPFLVVAMIAGGPIRNNVNIPSMDDDLDGGSDGTVVSFPAQVSTSRLSLPNHHHHLRDLVILL